MRIQDAMENEPLIDATLRAELSALYRAPARHYHGLAHIEALLTLAGQFRQALSDPDAVEAAIWFHDAIYDSRRSDNEKQSALLALERLAGRTGPERLARIATMIDATATHAIPDFGDEAANADAAFFLDMDLSILGAPPADFAAYEAAVRLEYAWVDDHAWCAGRTAVLEKFLARPHIFHTAAFMQRYEAQARVNIAQSLAALRR